MSTSSSDSKGLVQAISSRRESGALRGALIGFLPLALLAGISIITLLLTAFARQLVASSGFFAQQQTALIVLLAGFVLAIVVFAVATWRVIRRVTAWQQDGAIKTARSALWAIGITTVIVVLPLLLAIALPQHPAP